MAPQNCLPRCRNSIISFRDDFPLMYCIILLADMFGGERHQNMHVVPRHMPLQNLDLVRPTNLPYQFPQPSPHRTRQHWLAVLGDPDEVVLDVKSGMGGSTVVFHPSSVPEGFA